MHWIQKGSKTFTCDECGKTFPKGVSDEEQKAEQELLFPGLSEEDSAVVCDYCFKKMGF